MTTIAPETRINGRIEGDADVLVQGRVDGTIVLTETLTVAPHGFVSGDVQAKIIVVEGFASGTLRASAVVHLTSTAQVEGEIFAAAVRLDPGARLQGRVEMDVAAAPPLPTRPERPARAESRPSQTATRRPGTATAPATAAPVAAPAPVRTPDPEPAPEPEPEAEKPAPVAAAPAPAPVAARPPVAKSQPPAAKAQPAPPKAAASHAVEIDPDELTVKELREMLTERGLPLSGTKTELVRRLRTGE